MQAYIEDVILDNLVIDFIILFACKKILKENSKNIFLFLSSMIGSISSVLYVIFNLQGFALIFYKFFVGILMLCIAFSIKSFKNFLLKYLCFIFTTACMGGVCFLITFSFGKMELVNGAFSYALPLPMWSIMLLVFISAYFILQVIKSAKRKNILNDFFYNAQIKNKGKKIRIRAYLDTGNTLLDEKTQAPIFILTYKNFKKLFDVPLDKLLLNKITTEIEGAHYQIINSVGKSTKTLIFPVEEILIEKDNKKNVLKNQLLALSYANLEKKLDCGLLLNRHIKENFNGNI